MEKKMSEVTEAQDLRDPTRKVTIGHVAQSLAKRKKRKKKQSPRQKWILVSALLGTTAAVAMAVQGGVLDKLKQSSEEASDQPTTVARTTVQQTQRMPVDPPIYNWERQNEQDRQENGPLPATTEHL